MEQRVPSRLVVVHRGAAAARAHEETEVGELAAQRRHVDQVEQQTRTCVHSLGVKQTPCGDTVEVVSPQLDAHRQMVVSWRGQKRHGALYYAALPSLAAHPLDHGVVARKTEASSQR